MITYCSLGMRGFSRSKELHLLIKWGEITLGGNCKDKIYGTLQCRAGKRLKPQNRVFFTNEQEAIEAGYRPCAHCMPVIYKAWKKCGRAIKNI